MISPTINTADVGSFFKTLSHLPTYVSDTKDPEHQQSNQFKQHLNDIRLISGLQSGHGQSSERFGRIKVKIHLHKYYE